MQGYKLTSEPVIFLYTFIYAINYLTLPQLVLEKVCLKENPGNHTNCKHPEKLPDSIQKVSYTWDKVFKSGPSKIYGRQPFKNLFLAGTKLVKYSQFLFGSSIHPKMVVGKDILKTFLKV